jgi:hypothetical protein
MQSDQGRPFRGEFDNTPGAGSSTPINLFDVDGNILTLAADERLVITDVAYRCTAASDIRVYFDSLLDGLKSQPGQPILGHTPAGTGIAGATYTIYYTFYDPFTQTETVRSATQAVTASAGDNITITAPTALPAYMKDRLGNQGYMKVYVSTVGLVGQSAPGSNAVTITSVAALGPESASSGASSSGKIIGGALLGANGCWADAFSTPKVGPPGILAKLISSVATPIIVLLSGRIIRNAQL